MLGFTRRIFAAFLFVALGACETVAPSVSFDKTSANVEAIAVAGLMFPEQTSAIEATGVQDSVGAYGGFIGSLIGGAVDASNRSKRESKFKTIVEERNHSGQDVMRSALTGSLEARGYAVEYVDAPREKAGEYLVSYPAVQGGVDAYLDIAVESYGYLKTAGKTPWKPMLWLKCRLVSVGDLSVLMERTIYYNYVGQTKGAVMLTPNEAYAFSNFDEVVADPDRALAGLDDAVIGVADAIAAQLE